MSKSEVGSRKLEAGSRKPEAESRKPEGVLSKFETRLFKSVLGVRRNPEVASRESEFVPQIALQNDNEFGFCYSVSIVEAKFTLII